MHLRSIQVVKYFITHTTWIRILSSMCAFMLGWSTFLWEWFLAQITGMWMLSSVWRFMHLQGYSHDEKTFYTRQTFGRPPLRKCWCALLFVICSPKVNKIACVLCVSFSLHSDFITFSLKWDFILCLYTYSFQFLFTHAHYTLTEVLFLLCWGQAVGCSALLSKRTVYERSFAI